MSIFTAFVLNFSLLFHTITEKGFFVTFILEIYFNTYESCFLVSNNDTSPSIRNCSYRFGFIEYIFKPQKASGFMLASTNTQKKYHYYLKIRTLENLISLLLNLTHFFNLGLTIFNRCYYNALILP